MQIKFAADNQQAIPIDFVESENLIEWVKDRPKSVRTWVESNGFTASLGQFLLLPDDTGKIVSVLAGWGSKEARSRGRLWAAQLALSLPNDTYKLASGLTKPEMEEATLAWAFAQYSYNRYKEKSGAGATLVPDESLDMDRISAMAEGDFLTRNLINTPASDMGPDMLEKEFRKLANNHGADVITVKGQALLEKNFPLIHAVGRASDQEPRLLEMTWGKPDHPNVTLVGKGVCFDTGGLNIKSGASMGLMKKDMGGGATVLGLAHMIMSLGLKIRLRVLVPAVENSISAGAYRPQDVLKSRKGQTIEINNTDAEGRLVLADALTYADEEKTDLIVCMATLTGAARVALGPDVPPFYTDDDELAKIISIASEKNSDPLWRMPFWQPYEAMIEPDIADLDNAPKGGAGSITAALFLRRFVENADSFVHLDIYGWTPSAKPGRSFGGACQSARAMLGVIERRFSSD